MIDRILAWDLNEWYLLGWSAGLVLLYWMVPRRFGRVTFWMIWLFVVFLVQTADYILGVPPYDMYDFLDKPKWELPYGVAQFTLYPMIGYFFLYGFDRWEPKKWRLAGYLLLWSSASTVFEWSCLKTGVLKYKDWQLWYSFFTYISVFVLEIVYFRFVKKWLRQEGMGWRRPEKT